MLILLLDTNNPNLGIQQMRYLQVLSAALILLSVTVAQAYASAKVNDLLDATSDTKECKLLPSNPYLEKKVSSNFPLNAKKTLVADVYQLGTGVKNPTWVYIVKDVKTKKTVGNLYLAYEGSNLPYGPKMVHAWQPAIGTCGFLKKQRVIVGNHINQSLGNFFLTQPVGDLTTQVPSFKSLRIQ
jgi:hypothetical protein